MCNKIIWNEKEIEILKQNFEYKTNKELSILLNKTTKNIGRTLKRLNLYKNKEKIRLIKTRRNKEVGRDLNFNIIQKIAKNFNSKGEFYQFDPVAYNKASKDGFLNLVCSHMVSKTQSIPQLMLQNILEYFLGEKCSYNDRNVIKPFEIDCYFHKWNIGWEYNGIRYHTNNKNDTIKKELCLNRKIHLFEITETTLFFRNYRRNIKTQLIMQLEKINEITKLNLKENDILNYDIKIVLPNMLTLDEIEFVKNKKLTEIKKQNKKLYEKIIKYSLYNNSTYCIIFDLKKNKKFKTYIDYLNYLRGKKYKTFTDACIKEHIHRTIKKFNISIKTIRKDLNI